jgi:hypothetical protein|tara:strand:- start:447 stop:1037 length:591 start_codon:yes stop_codon:yes gene_type:complete
MNIKKMNLIRIFFLTLFCSSAQGHHVLGRPSYSLNEDSTTPPSMQVEVQVGEYYITYMVFPAFPSPNQPGRVNLYASRIDNGEPFQGQVIFKVRDNNWLNKREEVLGIQAVDDNVFRQGFEFQEAGNYIIRAEFESDSESYQIDFPLRIGDASVFGPIGVTVSLIALLLITVNLLQRKKLINAKISPKYRYKDKSL